MRLDKLHLANSKPGATAISFHSKKLTYAQMEAEVQKYAGYFKSIGVQEGVNVALLCPNSPEFILAYWGITRAGAVVVPINLMFTPEEIIYVLDNSDSRVLVVHPVIVAKFGAQALEHLGARQVVVLDESTKQLIAASEPCTGFDGGEDTLAAILYTSGTTGKPKGAMLTHSNLFSDVVSLSKSTIVGPYDNFLCVLPMFHSFAWTVCVLLPLFRGGTTVILESFQPNELLKTIVEEKITFLLAVPPMYSIFLRKALPEQFKNVYVAVSGGAPLPKEIYDAFTSRFPVFFVEGYGLTEAGPVVAINPVEGMKKQGSIGRPIPDIEVIIGDEKGREVPAGEVGEILIKGNNVMQGYYKDAQATAEAFVNGWLRTGDMAVRDEDGYIFIVDRKKEIIIVSGFNVYPREIEDILYRHPKVEEAAVIGIPDETRGEAPKAFVVPKEGETIEKKELMAFLKSNLAQYKLPREIVIAETLPKNAAGKIMKKLLKQQESS